VAEDGAKSAKAPATSLTESRSLTNGALDAFRFYVFAPKLDIGPDGNWTDADSSPATSRTRPMAWAISSTARSRCSSGYRNGVVPPKDDELAALPRKAATKHALYSNKPVQSALQSIWGSSRRANPIRDQTAPFKLAKDPAQAKRLDEVLYNLTETAGCWRFCSGPFLPGTAVKIYAQLGLTGTPDNSTSATGAGLPVVKDGEPAPCFRERMCDFSEVTGGARLVRGAISPQHVRVPGDFECFPSAVC